jgi:hypothetical protein
MKHAARHPRQSPRSLEFTATDRPSDDIAQAKLVLDALIAFLDDTRRSLAALHASPDGRRGATTGHLLEVLLAQARRSPALAPARTIAPRKSKRVVQHQPSDEEAKRARALCEAINASI